MNPQPWHGVPPVLPSTRYLRRHPLHHQPTVRGIVMNTTPSTGDRPSDWYVGPLRRPAIHTLIVVLASLISSVLILLLAICTPGQVQAAELSGITVGAHLATGHNRGGRDPYNPGLYLRTPGGWTVGAYRNSYRNTSVYGAYTAQWLDGRVALTTGLVTGYGAAAVLPLVVPSVRIGLGNSGLNARLSYLPKPPSYGTAAGLHLSVEHTF